MQIKSHVLPLAKALPSTGLVGVGSTELSTRYELYPFCEGPLSIAAVNQELDVYRDYYNDYQPHDDIALETPMSYYRQLMQAA